MKCYNLCVISLRKQRPEMSSQRACVSFDEKQNSVFFPDLVLYFKIINFSVYKSVNRPFLIAKC